MLSSIKKAYNSVLRVDIYKESFECSASRCFCRLLRKYLTYRITARATQDLPWRNIWLADNNVEVLTNICLCWLNVFFQPRSSVFVTRISHGLMINAGMLLGSSRRIIFVGLVIALGLTGFAVK